MPHRWRAAHGRNRDRSQKPWLTGTATSSTAYGKLARPTAKHGLFDNWPLQYALEMPPGCEAFYDHVGNEFRTLAQMCRYYEIDRAVFAKRYDAGWSLEEALMLPVGKTPKRRAGEKEESLSPPPNKKT